MGAFGVSIIVFSACGSSDTSISSDVSLQTSDVFPADGCIVRIAVFKPLANLEVCYEIQPPLRQEPDALDSLFRSQLVVVAGTGHKGSRLLVQVNEEPSTAALARALGIAPEAVRRIGARVASTEPVKESEEGT